MNSVIDAELSDQQIRNIKSQTLFRPEYIDMLDEHLTDVSFSSFAGVVKVNHTTLYVWLEKYPKFKEVRDKHLKPKLKLYR